MTPRRRLLAAASAAITLLALTACEKPAPIVTVVSGGKSVYTEASLYCFEQGQTLESGGCAQRAQGVTQLEVRPGNRIGIDVDKELAEGGWDFVLSDPKDPSRTQGIGPLESNYFPFSVPAIENDGSLLLTVRSLGPSGQPTGEWQFQLANSL